MRYIHHRLTVPSALACTCLLLEACATHSPTSINANHIRGTVESVGDGFIAVATSTGTVRVQLTQGAQIGTVVPSDREHIADGSFLGITSVTQPDGSERAVEVHVFPESMRGTGEGSYDWDLPGVVGVDSKMTKGEAASSRMTNGAVSRMTNGAVSSSRMTNGTLTAQKRGLSLTLEYKDASKQGSQTIILPSDIPIVVIEPGRPADLRAGAHVFVPAYPNPDGLLTADRVLVGKNGAVPPM
jgi:hypothetical protein